MIQNITKKQDLTMGSDLSDLLADVFIHINTINSCKNPFQSKIKYWFQYVDDVCLLETNKEEKYNPPCHKSGTEWKNPTFLSSMTI